MLEPRVCTVAVSLSIAGFALVPPAAAEPPEAYLGASAGGHLVLTDWAFREFDADFRPVSPESSPLVELRLGVDLTPRWSIEASADWLPFDAATETNDGFDFAARARWIALEGALSPYLLAGAGSYLNPHADPDGADPDWDWQIHYGVGVAPPLGDRVRLRVEARHQLTDPLDDDATFAHTLALLAGIDVLLGERAEAPPRDRDGDGIADDIDDCPDRPETVNGFEDADGCPDTAPPESPADRDGDGIPDDADDCPDRPETVNGFQDADGCPDTAPSEPQPPADRDGDGIPDDADDCPDRPETVNGFQDADGCPDAPPPADRDGDGIADDIDACPDQPETVNGFEDADGCPDAKPRVTVGCAALDFDEIVFFPVGRYTLTAEAEALLDQIARTLDARPDVRRIRATGFTDSTGSTALNDRLARQRSWVVREALIARGVAPTRVSVYARGEARPRASNTTADGRAQNRRVEFTIVVRDPGTGCDGGSR